MSAARQFDLPLTHLRPAPTPPKRVPSPIADAAGNVLATRRYRLYRLVERTQAIIAEIEAELRRRGAVLNGPPKHRERTLPFRHNELPRLCLGVLRATGRPTHIREIAAKVLRQKGLDPLDRALADATVKRARDVLLLHKRKGIVRLVGAARGKGAKWALVE